MIFGLGKKPDADPVRRFWLWFVEHEDMLLHFERDRDRTFDQLSAQLRKVHRDLCFEFGPEAAKREFVVSAGGIKAAFPAVVSLIDLAPKLPRWHFTAFRPRRMTLNSIKYKGKQVTPNEIAVTLLHSKTDEKVGLRLFFPRYRGETVFREIGYLMLDEALGEFDVEMKVGPIEILDAEIETAGERFPLAELPVRFDSLIAELEGRIQRPS